MHESILPRVAAKITTKQAWDTLGNSYQGLDKVKTSKLQILRIYFDSLSMKETKSVDSFYTRVFGLINQLKSHGEIIEYQILVEKFIRSLPPRFESLVVTLEENKDMSLFTIDELQASLVNHEHIISRTNTSLEGAFAAQSSIRHGRGRGRINSRGRGIKFSRGGCSISPVGVNGRGQNQNQSHPSGHGFDK